MCDWLNNPGSQVTLKIMTTVAVNLSSILRSKKKKKKPSKTKSEIFCHTQSKKQNVAPRCFVEHVLDSPYHVACSWGPREPHYRLEIVPHSGTYQLPPPAATVHLVLLPERRKTFVQFDSEN